MLCGLEFEGVILSWLRLLESLRLDDVDDVLSLIVLSLLPAGCAAVCPGGRFLSV